MGAAQFKRRHAGGCCTPCGRTPPPLPARPPARPHTHLNCAISTALYHTISSRMLRGWLSSARASGGRSRRASVRGRRASGVRATAFAAPAHPPTPHPPSSGTLKSTGPQAWLLTPRGGRRRMDTSCGQRASERRRRLHSRGHVPRPLQHAHILTHKHGARSAPHHSRPPAASPLKAWAARRWPGPACAPAACRAAAAAAATREALGGRRATGCCTPPPCLVGVASACTSPHARCTCCVCAGRVCVCVRGWRVGVCACLLGWAGEPSRHRLALAIAPSLHTPPISRVRTRAQGCPRSQRIVIEKLPSR